MGKLIVDAFNVIGTTPNGWWRDRHAAVREFVTELHELQTDDTVIAVVDGRPIKGLDGGNHDGVEIVYASGGRNAADDRIVDFVKTGAEPVVVVTSDRELLNRVETLGAKTISANAFLHQLRR